jgi:ATPase subunit of ABC transporter with duplicated ATPase domains
LFVSHDRWFVSQLATRILEVTPTGLRDFPGTYAEYLERCGDDHLDADAVVLKSRAVSPSRERPADGSWEEQKRRRNRLDALPARRDKVLASIEAAEARRKAIHEAYAEPGFFERTGREQLDHLGREDAELKDRIDAWMADWEQIEAELGQVGKAGEGHQ